MAKNDNYALFCVLRKRLIGELDPENPGTGMKAVKIIVQELGGIRLTVPTAEDMSREKRNDRIRMVCTGGNIAEVAASFSLSKSQIRKIITEGNHEL